MIQSLENHFLLHLKDEGTRILFSPIFDRLQYINALFFSYQEFLDESIAHGWPSFRDEEVVWENVRCLANGEAVSLVGTHLGHNLPDRKGNRYCINLVSVAGHENK